MITLQRNDLGYGPTAFDVHALMRDTNNLNCVAVSDTIGEKMEPLLDELNEVLVA